MNWGDLGMDQGTGTVGASSLGAVHDSAKNGGESKKRICHEPGCGTVLRSGNPGNFCSLHTCGERRGKKYVDSLDALRQKRIHVVSSR